MQPVTRCGDPQKVASNDFERELTMNCYPSNAKTAQSEYSKLTRTAALDARAVCQKRMDDNGFRFLDVLIRRRDAADAWN